MDVWLLFEVFLGEHHFLKTAFRQKTFFLAGGQFWLVSIGKYCMDNVVHVYTYRSIHYVSFVSHGPDQQKDLSNSTSDFCCLSIHSSIHPSIYLYFQTHVKAISGADLTVLEVSRSSFIYLNDWELGACLSFSWSRIRFSIFSIITWWYFPVPPLKLSNGGHGSMAWWIFNKMPFYGHGVVAHGSRYFHGG